MLWEAVDNSQSMNLPNQGVIPGQTNEEKIYKHIYKSIYLIG